MGLPQRLASRIVLAFVLMSIAVAGGFALSLKFAMDWVELQLVSESLERQLDSILEQEASTYADRHRLGPDLRLYSYTHGSPPASLPDFIRDYGPGFHEHERELQREAWHFLIRDVDDVRHVLMLDQYDFEQREDRLQLIVLSGFVLSVLVAWLLGRALARRVIAPVVRLASQVQGRDQLLALAPPLAPDYDNDEVGKLARAFDSTLGQLRAALERERLFTSDISHELRTPLMIIASSCELLASGRLDDAHRHQVTARIEAACAEMSALVEAFLELARNPARQGRREGIDLESAARAQIARWQPEAERTGRTLILSGSAPIEARYSAPLLNTVLSNLLRNALHHSGGEGEGTDTIRIILRAHGFSVIDPGTGIAEHQREQLFSPFSLGDDSAGTGIGLSLVDRICRNQGWTVHVHDHAASGCEFRVDFAPESPPHAPRA